MAKIRNGRWGTRAEAKQWDTHPQVQRQYDSFLDQQGLIKYKKKKRKRTRIERMQRRFNFEYEICLMTWYMRLKEPKNT
jgi:hypothetical protein